MITTILASVAISGLGLIAAFVSPDVAAYGGLLVACAAAWQSTRITGPNRQKILAEAGGLADKRILEWSDRITAENAALRAREQWLEARVDQLEDCIRRAGIPVPLAPPPPAVPPRQ